VLNSYTSTKGLQMANIVAYIKSRMNIFSTNQGESYKNIILYWLPEIVSIFVLVTLPPTLDDWIVTRLGSISIYGACSMGNNFLHLLLKMAEFVPVAAIAIIGRHNGAKEYEKCGQDLGYAFWTAFIFGLTLFVLMFFGSIGIYHFLGVPEHMVGYGVPFLQIKSFGIFLTFTGLGLVGFMRAVKNTRVPMMINIASVGIFVFFDYALVLGAFGFPKLGLVGSAVAMVLQYMAINVFALVYILTNRDYKKYFSIVFLRFFSIKESLHILSLSWPVMVDKMSVAASYVWLSKMIASMGEQAIASYGIVKNLERFAFTPIVSTAVIITFLVSNRLGAGDPEGASANIKKTFILSLFSLIPAIIFVCVFSRYLVSCFDPKNLITDFASTIVPMITPLLILDFMQVYLAGALRGAGDFKVVIITRLFCSRFVFCKHVANSIRTS
jgi:putative MATE family efflux protein